MGTWGTALFSDDTARDIRDHYRELIEDGVDDAEATRQTLEKFRAYLDDSEVAVVCIIALALTQSKIGRLDPGIRDQALAAIDGGADLRLWASENPKSLAKRREALIKARAQLTGPQPAHKRLRPPRRPSCGLAAGDILALTLPKGVALLRVVRVKSHRLGEVPYLERLDYEGSQLPLVEEIDRLEATTIMHPVDMIHASSGDTRFTAFTAVDKIDWAKAGFTKLVTVAVRPEEEQAIYPSYGVAWSVLVERYRKQAVV